MNKAKAKYPLLSLISIAACGIIGTAWAELMIKLCGLRYASDGGNALPMMLLLTFAAVSVIYAAAERLGAKCGFSKGEFFIWFVVIPFSVILIPVCLLTGNAAGLDSLLLGTAFLIMETAYIIAAIFCTARLILYMILTALRKGDLNGYNS